jgi:hypothetical protein
MIAFYFAFTCSFFAFKYVSSLHHYARTSKKHNIEKETAVNKQAQLQLLTLAEIQWRFLQIERKHAINVTCLITYFNLNTQKFKSVSPV